MCERERARENEGEKKKERKEKVGKGEKGRLGGKERIRESKGGEEDN